MRTSERACPFCHASCMPRSEIAELKLLNAWDRRRIATFGALLGAAGIALGCRGEAPPVAVYGGPPAPEETASPVPTPAPEPSSEPAPSTEPAAPPAPSASAAPSPSGDPARRNILAPAYGGPPRPQLAPVPTPSK